MPSRKKKNPAKSRTPPEQPPTGKQTRSNSTVPNDPPPTPPRIRKPTVHFDTIPLDQTGKKQGKKKGKRDNPPKPVRLTWGPTLVPQYVTIAQALDAAEELEEIKRKAAEDAIAKFKAQLDAQRRGDLTAKEVDAAAALVKAAATAKAEAKAATVRARETDKAAIQNSPTKPASSQPETVEDSDDSSMDPRLRKEFQEQENYEEWQQQQYTYSVKATLKADTLTGLRVKWSNRIGTENWVKDNFNINFLLLELHKAMDQHGLIGDLYNIIVFAKSTHSRATKHRIDLEALTEDVWNTRVKSVLREEWKRKPGYHMDVFVECTGKEPPKEQLKRPFNSIASPSNLPHRRTRTIALEEQSAARRDRNEIAGDYTEQLVEKWICTSDRCNNQNNYCYIAFDGKHYRINTSQREVWASAIASARDGATLDHPPREMLKLLIEKQGAVGEALRAPAAKERRDEKKDRMDKIFDIIAQQAEFNFLQTTSQAIAPHPHPLLPVQSPQPYWQSQYPPPPLPPPPTAVPAAQNTTQIERSSSPIAPNEDEIILYNYWDWKARQLKSADAVARLSDARAIVEREIWSIEDLKKMSDPESKLYQTAVLKGLPDGLTRQFRKDLSKFKPVYRTVYSLARMRQDGQEGGFIRDT